MPATSVQTDAAVLWAPMRSDPAASPAPSHPALAVTVVSLALAYGVWYAYSVFLVALLREFGWSRSVLAGAFSVFARVASLRGLRPAHRRRRGHGGMDARRGDGAAPVEGTPGPGARHRGLRSRPRYLLGGSTLPGADRRLRLALGLPCAGRPLRLLDPARHLPGDP